MCELLDEKLCKKGQLRPWKWPDLIQRTVIESPSFIRKSAGCVSVYNGLYLRTGLLTYAKGHWFTHNLECELSSEFIYWICVSSWNCCIVQKLFSNRYFYVKVISINFEPFWLLLKRSRSILTLGKTFFEKMSSFPKMQKLNTAIYSHRISFAWNQVFNNFFSY